MVPDQPGPSHVGRPGVTYTAVTPGSGVRAAFTFEVIIRRAADSGQSTGASWRREHAGERIARSIIMLELKAALDHSL